jgi:hypothetical protein
MLAIMEVVRVGNAMKMINYTAALMIGPVTIAMGTNYTNTAKCSTSSLPELYTGTN